MSQSPKKQWKFDAEQETWLFGTNDQGGGVYQMPSSSVQDKQIWTGTSVSNGKAVFVGEHETKDAAMLDVEEVFSRMEPHAG